MGTVPTGMGLLRMMHSRVSMMLLPVDRSIKVSAPHMVDQASFSTSSSMELVTALLPMLELTLVRKLRPESYIQRSSCPHGVRSCLQHRHRNRGGEEQEAEAGRQRAHIPGACAYKQTTPNNKARANTPSRRRHYPGPVVTVISQPGLFPTHKTHTRITPSQYHAPPFQRAGPHIRPRSRTTKNAHARATADFAAAAATQQCLRARCAVGAVLCGHGTGFVMQRGRGRELVKGHTQPCMCMCPLASAACVANGIHKGTAFGIGRGGRWGQ
mmetsp:Transcript_27052/g.69711  ORF Transcript_27052/g.69711 Transcript_27052/m.69711 type:complete len:270 (-) Transcript_27052:809-1618(-)